MRPGQIEGYTAPTPAQLLETATHAIACFGFHVPTNTPWTLETLADEVQRAYDQTPRHRACVAALRAYGKITIKRRADGVLHLSEKPEQLCS